MLQEQRLMWMVALVPFYKTNKRSCAILRNFFLLVPPLTLSYKIKVG